MRKLPLWLASMHSCSAPLIMHMRLVCRVSLSILRFKRPFPKSFRQPKKMGSKWSPRFFHLHQTCWRKRKKIGSRWALESLLRAVTGVCCTTPCRRGSKHFVENSRTSQQYPTVLRHCLIPFPVLVKSQLFFDRVRACSRHLAGLRYTACALGPCLDWAISHDLRKQRLADMHEKSLRGEPLVNGSKMKNLIPGRHQRKLAARPRQYWFLTKNNPV